jgi:hypothetical protein
LSLIQSLFEQGRVGEEFTLQNPQLGAMMLLGAIRSVVRDGGHPRPAGLALEVVKSFLFGAAEPIRCSDKTHEREANHLSGSRRRPCRQA